MPDPRTIRIAGRTVVLSSEHVATRDVLEWYLRRGVIPAARGTLRRLSLGEAAMPLAIGHGVRIFGGRHLKLGRGVVIGDYCWFSCLSQEGVRLADRVTIREFGWIQCASSLDRPPGIGLTIGTGTYIGPRSYLGVSGPIAIGAHCDIGGSFTVIGENHVVPGLDESLRGRGTEAQGVTIGDDCWIGNNVTVLDGVTVGDGAVLGAGAVVTHSVPAGSVAVGVPAKVIRTRA